VTERTRLHEDEALYWNEQRELGLVYYGRAHRPLHAHSHHDRERFGVRGSAELFAVSVGDGTRDYLHTQLLIPGNEIAREVRLADGQAWHYPADRTLVLWELLLEQATGVGDPRESFLYRTLWTRYEQYLTRRFAGVQVLLTTWEDQFPRLQWEGFVSALGYHRTQPGVFRKEVARL
jgi:hypothetical protein